MSDFIQEFGRLTREGLDNPATEERICYGCNKSIEGRVNFIEWIPLFFRYVCYCDECHEKRDVGEYVEVIKVYEEYLSGKCTKLDYMKIYYKYHPDKFKEFLDKVPENKRDIIRGWFE